MADYESSFNATGPTVVAFETTSDDTPVAQAFGASVVGKTCGVYGQGTFDAQSDRRSAPMGTGVLGRGDAHGVYGISSRVTAENTPSFDFLANQEALGVVGVNAGNPNGDAPAVFGDNNILQNDFANPRLNKASTALHEAAGLAAGVGGISWTGLGAYGISLNLDPAKSADLSKDAEVASTVINPITDAIDPPVRNASAPAGVLGLSVQGAGVRGVSRLDRGGIFQSATARDESSASTVASNPRLVAQIRLVPHRVFQTDPRTQDPSLPREGQTGDLLAVVAPDGNRRFQAAQLWFCEKGQSSSGAAVWRKVALSDSVTGTI